VFLKEKSRRVKVKYILTFTNIAALSCFIFISVSATAANKSIYIKPFSIENGIQETDSIGVRIQNYISEDIIDKGGYSLTSDEEVKQVILQEELRMSLDVCSDDSCIKKLMESIRTDYIIYGNVSFEDSQYHITAKMLDRTDGVVKLSRVKSLSFKDKGKIRMVCTDLANYLIDGKTIDADRYSDASYELVRPTVIKSPEGLAVSFIYFKPAKDPFNYLYDGLIGGGLDYVYSYNKYFGISGGVYYVQDKNTSGDVIVSLNSYSIGLRAGIPLIRFLYPYVGVSGRVTWFNERTEQESFSFTGLGGDGYAGCAFMIGSNFSLWGDYSISVVKLNDDEKTDISGSVIRGGLMIAF